MKHILITIVAVLLWGCGSSPVHSGKYTMTKNESGEGDLTFELKPDGSFLLEPKDEPDDKLIGSWKVEGEMLVLEGTSEKTSQQLKIKFNKSTGKVDSVTSGNIEVPKDQLDGTIVKKHEGKTDEEIKTSEPVAEATKPDSLKNEVTDISIHDAAGIGKIEAVKQYLDAGGDVNAKDKDSAAPLHYAAYNGNKEIVEMLISKGADLNISDNEAITPLHLSAKASDFEISQLLISSGANVNALTVKSISPLYEATTVESINPDLVKLLIDNKANINAKSKGGVTPLISALFSADVTIVQILIENGAELNEVIHSGPSKNRTALDVALRLVERSNNSPIIGMDLKAKQLMKIAELLRKQGGKTAEELKAAEN